MLAWPCGIGQVYMASLARSQAHTHLKYFKRSKRLFEELKNERDKISIRAGFLKLIIEIRPLVGADGGDGCYEFEIHPGRSYRSHARKGGLFNFIFVVVSVVVISSLIWVVFLFALSFISIQLNRNCLCVISFIQRLCGGQELCELQPLFICCQSVALFL
jgi:hypothetical protein